jgi:hypothetical protein
VFPTLKEISGFASFPSRNDTEWQRGPHFHRVLASPEAVCSRSVAATAAASGARKSLAVLRSASRGVIRSCVPDALSLAPPGYRPR